MDVKAIKLELMQQLLQTNDETLLAEVKKLLSKHASDTYNNEIDEAENRITSGKFTTQDVLEEEAKKWKKKD
ncbi:MAG: hypothetical protein EA412_04165 [Chitinophagaceae bacterium]|nr:MAG: hypothetical protein EA412_04165 [Chitinophagaceae bacterium]